MSQPLRVQPLQSPANYFGFIEKERVPWSEIRKMLLAEVKKKNSLIRLHTTNPVFMVCWDRSVMAQVSEEQRKSLQDACVSSTLKACFCYFCYFLVKIHTLSSCFSCLDLLLSFSPLCWLQQPRPDWLHLYLKEHYVRNAFRVIMNWPWCVNRQ